MSKRVKKNIRGFTLIELLVVVAVIGSLAAIGIVTYNGYVASTKKKSAINMMMQLALAQTEELSNAGKYWNNDDCNDIKTGSSDTSTSTSTKAIGQKFFNKQGYIKHELGYDMCITATAIGFNIIAKERKGTCELILDESTVVSETEGTGC